LDLRGRKSEEVGDNYKTRWFILPIKMINSRKMRIRHLREIDREKGLEKVTWES
jgi:hypothetical protein